MTTLEIKTKVDTSEAEASVSKLDKALGKLTQLQEAALKEQENLNDNVKESSKQSVKALDNASKATSGLAKGFKGVGLAIKAAGIGLIIGALTALKDVFMQNQEVADAVASTFETVSIVFNKVVGAVVDSVKEVSKATNGFEKLGKVLSSLLTLVLTPLKLQFFALSLGIKQAQLVWEESFLGDNNPETVKRLNEEIEITKNTISEIAQEAVDAGGDLVNNFAGAMSEIGQVAVKTIEDVKDISVSAAIEQGKLNTELKNNAQLAAAQQQRVVEQFDRQAEKLRQIRDLESNSLAVRIKANEDLNKVLDEQEKALLKQADLQIAAAQSAVNINNSIENRIALTESLANKEGILAQVEGFRSEQQANINGLTREANQLTQTQLEGEIERARQLRELDVENEESELRKLELLRANFEIENEIILEDLERKRALYAEGTQARIDAEEDFLNRKQALEIEQANNEKKLAKSSVDIEESKEATKGKLISDGFKLAGQLAEDNANAQKGIAASEATFNTYAAIVGTLKGLSTNPTPGLAIGQAIATGVFGFTQVAKILSTNVSSGSSPSISSPSSSSVPTQSEGNDIPNFDFINQGIGGNSGSELNRNYVVLQDIKDKEVLRERIKDISVTA